jgi:hypothetical protein
LRSYEKDIIFLRLRLPAPAWMACAIVLPHQRRWHGKDFHVKIVIRCGRLSRANTCGTMACFGRATDFSAAKNVKFEKKTIVLELKFVKKKVKIKKNRPRRAESGQGRRCRRAASVHGLFVRAFNSCSGVSVTMWSMHGRALCVAGEWRLWPTLWEADTDRVGVLGDGMPPCFQLRCWTTTI